MFVLINIILILVTFVPSTSSLIHALPTLSSSSTQHTLASISSSKKTLCSVIAASIYDYDLQSSLAFNFYSLSLDHPSSPGLLKDKSLTRCLVTTTAILVSPKHQYPQKFNFTGHGTPVDPEQQQKACLFPCIERVYVLSDTEVTGRKINVILIQRSVISPICPEFSFKTLQNPPPQYDLCIWPNGTEREEKDKKHTERLLDRSIIRDVERINMNLEQNINTQNSVESSNTEQSEVKNSDSVDEYVRSIRYKSMPFHKQRHLKKGNHYGFRGFLNFRSVRYYNRLCAHMTKLVFLTSGQPDGTFGITIRGLYSNSHVVNPFFSSRTFPFTKTDPSNPRGSLVCSVIGNKAVVSNPFSCVYGCYERNYIITSSSWQKPFLLTLQFSSQCPYDWRNADDCFPRLGIGSNPNPQRRPLAASFIVTTLRNDRKEAVTRAIKILRIAKGWSNLLIQRAVTPVTKQIENKKFKVMFRFNKGFTLQI